MFDKKAAPFNPRYKHDCGNCIFLGQYAIADLYACINEEGKISTVIARYSSGNSDYISGLSRVRLDGVPDLIEAFRRAVLKGYLPIKEYMRCISMFVWEGTGVEQTLKFKKII